MSKAIKPYIYCDIKSINAKKALMLADCYLTHRLEQADVLWFRAGHQQYLESLTNNQCLNHLSYESIIADKGKLTQLLQNYQKENSISKFYPESYRLYVDSDREAFFQQLPEKDSEENLWILKPDDLSSGRGVKVLWQFDKLREHFSKLNPNPKLCLDGQHQSQYIIQRYIKNPLLLNGRKSEIRIYWLIASLNPLKVFIYPRGTARLTVNKFQLGDYDNPLVHITNEYQQKKHVSGEVISTLKWSFLELENYLLQQHKIKKAAYIEHELLPELKASLAHVVNSAKTLLQQTPSKNGHYFALFGADFIIDDNLKPWLTEIQRGPGLSMTSTAKKNVIVNLLDETIKIVLEIRDKKNTRQSLKDLQALRNFEEIDLE